MEFLAVIRVTINYLRLLECLLLNTLALFLCSTKINHFVETETLGVGRMLGVFVICHCKQDQHGNKSTLSSHLSQILTCWVLLGKLLDPLVLFAL